MNVLKEAQPGNDPMACALHLKLLLRVTSPDSGVKWTYVHTPHITLKHCLERSQSFYIPRKESVSHPLGGYKACMGAQSCC